jgi:nucleoside-triphosphatase THEP1
MPDQPREDPSLVWERAAALGGLWAAAEIVLGSFLHNLRVPMAGQLLTALAAALLSAAHRRMGGRGLLWRAGLVCAALKSMSPSAVLIGPMAAIAMEGLLMESGLRLLGARPAGYALGGALAMSWTYAHLLGRTVLVYGFDAASLYEAAWGRVRSGLGMTLGSWELLALLGAAHAAAGAGAALAGLRLPAGGTSSAAGGATLPAARPGESPRLPPSLAGFAANLVLVAALLAAVRRLTLPWAAASTALAVAVWAFLYPATLRRLRRPSLWLGLAAVGAGAGLLLGDSGVEAGVRMTLRALALTAGFAALSQELAGRHIREGVRRLGAGVWLGAVEAAFASLPAFVARLPEARVFLRRPGAAIAALLEALPGGPALYVLEGGKAQGKTTLALAAAAALRARGLSVSGIAAPGLWEDGQREGFDIVDLRDGRRLPLCRKRAPASWTIRTGPYRFSPEGLALGRAALDAGADADVVIVDEVGPLELSGGGWAAELDRLASARVGPMLWVARTGLIEEIAGRWGRPRAVWPPSSSIEDAAEALAAAAMPPLKAA